MRRVSLAGLAPIAFTAASALALDIGDPTFPMPESGETIRTEAFYSTLHRRVGVDSDPVGFGPPGGGPVSFMPRAGWLDTTENDQFVSRVVFWPAPMYAVQLDLGFAGDGNGGGDHAVILGGALRGLLAESGPVQLTAQLHGAVMPEVDYRLAGETSLGTYFGRGESDFYEAGGAVLLSFAQPVNDSVQGTLYSGVDVTTFREEWRSYADYSTITDRVWLSGVNKDRSPWRFILGGHLRMGETWGLRSEARVAGATEFSAGVTWRK